MEFAPALAVPFGLGAGAGILSWYVVLIRIVRRYREKPSPLVRDTVRGWRTGRLDRVLGGHFDLLTAGSIFESDRVRPQDPARKPTQRHLHHAWTAFHIAQL